MAGRLGARTLGFWATLAGVFWILVGYPVSLLLFRPRRWRQDSLEPSVTVLVPTYYERDTLPRKLQSVASLDYPADRIQVVVAVDGNAELAKIARAELPSAEVVVLPERSGKPTALNLGLEAAKGEIVVLTDAHNPLDPRSVRRAVRHFADKDIWAVTGRCVEAGSAYDRYENLLRRLETRSGSVAGMFGGFTAIRRGKVPKFPPEVVNEDLWLLCHLVRDGGRVIYEPEASSHEPSLATRREVERRTRISAGRMMLLNEMQGLPPTFLWRLTSHKLGRLALPFLLLGTFVFSLSLARRPHYRGVAAVQSLGYGIGALDAAGHRLPLVPRWASGLLRQFVLGNYAAGAGVIRALRRRQSVLWNRVR
jgi:poly-beta-1,6-N-acetyl-D-glucosamine synthase